MEDGDDQQAASSCVQQPREDPGGNPDAAALALISNQLITIHKQITQVQQTLTSIQLSISALTNQLTESTAFLSGQIQAVNCNSAQETASGLVQKISNYFDSMEWLLMSIDGPDDFNKPSVKNQASRISNDIGNDIDMQYSISNIQNFLMPTFSSTSGILTICQQAFYAMSKPFITA